MGPQQGLNLGWGDDLEASRYNLEEIRIPCCNKFNIVQGIPTSSGWWEIATLSGY